MDFEAALVEMKAGKAVRRRAWVFKDTNIIYEEWEGRFYSRAGNTKDGEWLPRGPARDATDWEIYT